MKMKQKSQSKLVIAMSAVILLLVALSATLTFAYFTAKTEGSSSSVTFGHLTLDGGNFAITETDTKIVPGDTIHLTGDVSMKNNIDAFYRAKIEVAVENSDTKGITATEIDDIRDAIYAAAGLNADTENAKQYTDGFFYGFVAGKDANVTTPVKILDFTSGSGVTFKAEDYGNKWQDVKITITLTVHAIQAKNLDKASLKGTAEDLTSNLKDLAESTVWTTAESQANA